MLFRPKAAFGVPTCRTSLRLNVYVKLYGCEVSTTKVVRSANETVRTQLETSHIVSPQIVRARPTKQGQLTARSLYDGVNERSVDSLGGVIVVLAVFLNI